MKRCFKCNQEKPLDQFYKHPRMADGYLNKCIECAKKDVNERYNLLKNDPNFILSERERTRQKYYRLNYKDKYGVRGEQKKEIIERYFAKSPQKLIASRITSNAIRNKRLIKKPCEICGTTQNIQAHHEDYFRPLEVRWLCIKHHNERHVELRKQQLLQKEFVFNIY